MLLFLKADAEYVLFENYSTATVIESSTETTTIMTS